MEADFSPQRKKKPKNKRKERRGCCKRSRVPLKMWL